MHLRQKLAKILSEDLTETRLLAELQRLVAEYDCDLNFYSNPQDLRSCSSAPTFDIPPPAYIQELELHLIYEQ